MAGAAPGAGLRRAARHVREVTAAPFWRRVLADLIDLSALLAVMALAFKLGIWGWPTLPERLYDPLDYAVEILIHHAARFTPIVLLLSALHLGARLLSYLTWGRTLGQRLLGLRLITRAGEPLAPAHAALHPLMGLLGVALLGVGYTWAAVDLERQSLAERLTRVCLIVDP